MSWCTHMILVSLSVHEVSVSCVCIHIGVLVCEYSVGELVCAYIGACLTHIAIHIVFHFVLPLPSFKILYMLTLSLRKKIM
jgi:hypothetical protein